MRASKYEIIIALIVLLSFAISGYFYPQMPDKMASHWNAQGQVDGYTSRLWGLFLVPLLLVGMSLLFIAIPRIDPLRANIEKFKKHYYGFIMLVLLFMFYVHLLTILWNLGIQFDMIRLLVPAFGAILYGCGILLEKSKKNWFIGIRTPWTLSNERVWDKTHRLGARLFKVAAILTLGGIFFRDYAIVFILIPVILVSLFTVVYSYLTYQKEFRANQLRG